jgi:signal transduction histidine kinase
MLRMFRSWIADTPDTEMRRVARNDVVITLPFAVLVLLEIWTSYLGDMPNKPALATVCGLAGVLPLAARRVAPLPALVAVMAGSLVGGLAYPDFKPFSPFLVWVLAAYTVAAHEPNDRALWGLIAGLTATGLMGVAGALQDQSGAFSVWIFLGAAWAAGRAIRSREQRAHTLQTRAEHLTAEQEFRAQRAIAEERTRIARELHDVVAHGVSVMVVQAGAAQRVLSQNPERAREALSSIETSGRQALVELRRMLGVLRASDAHASVEPQPVLARVGELVEHVRDAGIEAGLYVEGEPRGISAGADLAGYRIVQEALTNVIKHAEATSVDVRIRYLPEALELSIRDNGSGPRNKQLQGHGLIGMRERVAMFGGTLTAGNAPGGGFAVAAHIPLEGEAT